HRPGSVQRGDAWRSSMGGTGRQRVSSHVVASVLPWCSAGATRAARPGSLSSTDAPSGIQMKFVTAWFRVPFWQRVLAGFVLGALAGWAFGPAADTWFGPLGDLYVTLIKMIAVPLVFFAVIHAVSSLHGQRSMVALGGRTFAWFAATAVLAVCVGLLVGTVM